MKQLSPHSPLDDILNAALRTPAGKGVSLRFSSPDAAHAFRFRLYSHRFRARQRTKRELSPYDPNWGISPWDGLEILIDGADIWIGPYGTSAASIAPVSISITKPPRRKTT